MLQNLCGGTLCTITRLCSVMRIRLVLFPSIDEFEAGESGASVRRLIPRVILSRSGAEAKNAYDGS